MTTYDFPECEPLPIHPDLEPKAQGMPNGESLRAQASPVPWLVDGLIAKTGLTLIEGEVGVGKRQLALDLALSVATGRAWQDLPVTSVPALHLLSDISSTLGIEQAVAAWGARNPQGTTLEGYTLSRNRPVLLTTGAGGSLKEFVRDLVTPPGLLVIDPMNDFLYAEDRSLEGMTTVAFFLSALLSQRNLSIVLVRHSEGPAEDASPALTRLRAACDGVWRLERNGPYQRRLETIKAAGAAPRSFELEF